MVYVEFFDGKELLENLCSSFVRAPEKIYFLGGDKKEIERNIERYKRVLSARGKEVEMIPKLVNPNSVSFLVEKLSEIVETEDECIFDLTGGEDLCLVAMGIVFEKYRNKKSVQMHRFNLKTNKAYDCDEDGRVLYEKDLPEITLAENIRIFGGEIIYDDVKENTTHRWDMSDSFKRDIEVMWNICSTNVQIGAARAWDRQIMVFEKAEEKGVRETPLTTRASLAEIRKEVEADGKERTEKFYLNQKILYELQKHRLISFTRNDDEIVIKYKNEQIKRCLTKAGTVLEMKIYLLVLELKKERSDEPVYNDALHGVSIDWDGKIDGSDDVHNEIDVLAMHKMIPVFFSCKNGEVHSDELYKLYSVATRFGGKYSRKVMVISEIKLNKNEASIRRRAKDMDIEIIDPFELTAEELEKRIASIWSK